MDVNEELKFLGKFKKKNWEGVQGGVGGGVGLGGVRMDVNKELEIKKKKLGGGGRVGEGSGWM